MNIYKQKKFLSQFLIEEDVISFCPNSKAPVRSFPKYHENKIVGLFSKEDCNRCKYINKCIIKDYNKDFNEVELNLTLKKAEGFPINFENMLSLEGENSNEGISYVDILNQGINYRRQGKFEEAKERYLTAIRMEPKKSVGYFNLGKILYILNDHDASAKAYKVAYDLGELQNNIPQILEHMGHALIDRYNKEGIYKQVIDDYSRGMCTIVGYRPKASVLLRLQYTRKCQEEALKYLSEV